MDRKVDVQLAWLAGGMKLHVQKRLCHSNRLGPKKSVWLCVNLLPEIAEKKSDICTGLDLPNVDKLNSHSAAKNEY